MNQWLKHLLVNPLLVIFLLLLLVGGSVAFLALSQTGTRFLVNNAHYLVSGLEMEGVEGTLAAGLKAGRIRWESESATLEASSVAVDSQVEVASPPALWVRRLHVDKLVIRLPASQEEAEASQPFELMSIRLPLTVDARQISIDELEVWQGEHPLRLRDVQLDARAREGQLHVEKLQAQLYDAQGKVDVALDGSMALAQPHTLALNVAVDAASDTWGSGTAKAKVGGELLQYTLGLEADWAYADYPRYQAQLQGKGSFAELVIDKLRLNGEAGELSASGQLGWQDALVWAADVEGRQLNPAHFLKEWPANLDVALHSSGSLHQGKLQAATLDVTRLQGKLREYPVDIQGQGDWNGKVIDLRALDAKIGDNRLQASGNASDRLDINWQVDAPKLAQLDPRIRGTAKGNGTLRGLLDGSRLQLEVVELAGNVEGYDLQAKGKLDWGDAKLAAQDVVIQSGANRVEVSGQATEPFDLRWKVDAKNLAKAWKGLEGSLQGEGVFKGKLGKPEIQADLQGSKLRYQDYRLGAVDLQARQVAERYELQGTLKDFQAGETLIKSARIDGEGAIERHQMTAQVTHEAGKLELAASAGWQNGQWQGTLPKLALRDTPAGNWDMADPINLQVSDKALSSSMICLNNRGARACGKPAWMPATGFSIAGDLRQIPLVMLRSWLPETLSVEGVADADYRFEQRGGKPQASVALRLPDSSVKLRGNKGKVETLQYTSTRADLSLNDRQMDMQAQVDLVRYGQLRADGRIDLSPLDGNHRINARLNAAMPDIAWLERFSPQIEHLQGSVTGDVTLTGLLKKPVVNGGVKLTGGQVHLPEAGVTLEAITLDMQARGTERATIKGSLRAGAGMMTANGVLSLANLPHWQANVALQGNNLTLMDTHEIQALVSPNLSIQASPADVSISGSVLIPEATVSLREIPQTASARSDDVVIVGRSAETGGSGQPQVLVKDTPLNINPNVVIELGDKVKFNGFGLDARLIGKLRVLRTRQDIIAEGVLSVVDGVYNAYEQRLAIERGRLLFNGPLNNPGLDVRAVREVDEGDIKVGIALAGTVQQPESTLFSSPQQTQSDTLSYLLTGRAMSGLSGEQSSLLMEAITGLGIAGGENLAQRLGGSLGLDEVGLKAKNGNFDQSELALGKRLGARLYVRYIVGLFDSLQRVAITYQINKHLQVEAQAGLQQGVDLIYKIDTDKGLLKR
ncbi:autotransporter secretion inner membrane protein TamB [Thiothrix caldifontis]|uniref:Autotransporter secretion inner membrane protein TamB n=1 Tax=Thiothrix caldifontis TaxID=525918 RepID=A0A1H3VN78_9GAMM|nr:translocation/assembly module TamB domain-containing protein [Thiothrix caldifontis]SDZ76236.1 autotransporter secretion inner membrane protein TamB [Thiothrix caldifontis]